MGKACSGGCSKNLRELFGDELLLDSPPAYVLTDNLKIDGLTSLFYEGVTYKGRKNQVYAYYSAPSGQPPEGGWPAMVLVHGGGGTAFPWMVKAWNLRGFAAIAMDLEGHLPELEVSHELRSVHPRSGPQRKGCFDDDHLALEEQWFYHAVADVLLALSLMRSFQQIDAHKIGLFGISWGGIIGSTVIGLDHRFAFGIIAYGCGFTHESDGVLNPEGNKGVQWDPSNYLKGATTPMLYINGAKDKHFPLNTWQKTTSLLEGPIWRYLDINLGHGHAQPYALEEPFAFATQFVSDKLVVPVIHRILTVENKKLRFVLEGLMTIEKASLFYTTDQGLRSDRLWLEVAAEVNQRTIMVDFPEKTTAYFINVTDKQGLTYSSSYVETKESPKITQTKERSPHYRLFGSL